VLFDSKPAAASPIMTGVPRAIQHCSLPPGAGAYYLI
jgi:hypothetical protein